MRAGDVVDGRFELLQWVGAGGMGEVFRARDIVTGENAALKVLIRAGAGALTRISREAQVLSMMKVPGIVRYIGHGLTESGAPYLAMQWIEGETLEEHLTCGPLSLADTLSLARRVARALGVVHGLGLVHRDLKPANLMLPAGELSEVMLIDFGIALDARPAGIQRPGTAMQESITGTPGYMAPEQVQGLADIDARADVFALGCVLYECLAGKAAFSAGDLLSLLARVVLDEATSLSELCPGVPSFVEALCARMMSKRRESRPRDGAEVVELLSASHDLAEYSEAVGGEGANNLSAGERRRMALILVQEQVLKADDTLQMTLSETENTALLNRLRRELETYGAQFALVQPQWMLIVLSGDQSAGELSVRALRSALLVRETLGRAAIFVATGRAEVAGRLPVGELIDRTVELASQGRGEDPWAIRVDEVTAGLCGGRFLIVQKEKALWLMDELRDRGLMAEGAPLLLGRALPCFGREQEIAALSGALLRCLKSERKAGAALITGVVGLGKSRLVHESLRTMEREIEELEIWTARGDPMGAGSAFGLVSQALRRTVGIKEGEPKQEQIRKLEERVNKHPELRSKRVAIFLGEMLGLSFSAEGDIQLAAARRNAILMRDRIREAWEDFVRAESKVNPVILVLEDLHWGDLPTVNLMGAALRYAGDLPFFVLALGRPEVFSLFPSIWAEHEPFMLSLEPLPREAGEALCKEVLGESLDEARRTRMVERADGNPFFLEEQIREAAAGRLGSLPETVLSTVQARLDAFSAEARRVLRAGSVFGETFWRAGVERLLGVAEVGAELLALVEQEILVRQPLGRIEGEEEYRFRHSLLREAAYGLLTERDRRMGHALAGQWLEEVGEIDARTLAEHFGVGGMPAKAYSMWLRAAQEALRGNDLAGAVERAERGVLCGPDTKTLGALRRVQAEAHIWRGEYALAEERGKEAMERLEVGSAGWFEAAIQVGWALERRGAIERLGVLAQQILNTPAREGAIVARQMALADGASALLINGHQAQPDLILDHLETMACGDAEDAEILSRYCQAKASKFVVDGKPGLAIDETLVSIKAFESAGDHRNTCSSRMALGSLLTETGDYESAIAQLRIAQGMAERLSLDELGWAGLINLGLALAYYGEPEKGVQLEEEAIHAFYRLKGLRYECAATIYLGKILLLQRRFSLAEQRIRRAIELGDRVPGLFPLALALHASALLALDRPAEALSEAREAYSSLENQGGLEEGEALVRLTYAEALLANQERDTALSVLLKARDHILSRAQTFQDPKRREQFLRAVPDHARTLALAKELCGEGLI